MIGPKHILITGASSGIGAALALAYAQPNIQLSLHGRNINRLSSVADKARTQGAIVSILAGDICDAALLESWINACDQECPIDLVIANAGISGGTGIGCENPAMVKNIFDTNLTGVLNTVTPVLSCFVERQRGQIAIISSLASFRGFAGSAAYCASKAAVRVYGEALRSDYQRHGVQVSVVCPGFIKTPMTDVNRFPMPFIMSAERAAIIIRDGLQHDKPRIAFPFVMYALIRCMNALPQSWLDKVLARLPKKGR